MDFRWPRALFSNRRFLLRDKSAPVAWNHTQQICPTRFSGFVQFWLAVAGPNPSLSSRFLLLARQGFGLPPPVGLSGLVFVSIFATRSFLPLALESDSHFFVSALRAPVPAQVLIIDSRSTSSHAAGSAQARFLRLLLSQSALAAQVLWLMIFLRDVVTPRSVLTWEQPARVHLSCARVSLRFYVSNSCWCSVVLDLFASRSVLSYCSVCGERPRFCVSSGLSSLRRFGGFLITYCNTLCL
jgi:hypothetical protein